MEDKLEKVAQIHYEKLKLQDELEQLKSHSFYLEENFTKTTSSLSEKKNHIKSLELQISSFSQKIKEKEELIECLENSISEFKQLIEKLKSENKFLKQELAFEKLENKEIESLKTKEKELREAYLKIQNENIKLKSEIALKCDEYLYSVSIIEDLKEQLKELEDEKSEWMALKEQLFNEPMEGRSKVDDDECFLRKSPDWVVQKLPSDNEKLRDSQSSNLRIEILEAEVQEKVELINQLENFMFQKKKEESKLHKLLTEIKEKLKEVGLLNSTHSLSFNIDISTFNIVSNNLVKLINWSEARSGECLSLAEAASIAVTTKEEIETRQPAAQAVPTVSIASQTDPIKNLSPVLPYKCQNSLEKQSSDSDEDLESASFLEANGVGEGRQLFSNHKNSDLDMDIFRSCRKLSVLPEEDMDDLFCRKTSLKNCIYFKYTNLKFKTRSADDVYKLNNVNPIITESSSCISIIPCPPNDKSLVSDHTRNRVLHKESDALETAKFIKYFYNQPEISCTSSKQYSEPFPIKETSNDKNSKSPPSSCKKGNFFRKPRSTCRPLRVHCYKDEIRKTDKNCKVRFDLSSIKRENIEFFKESNENSKIITNDKIKVLSRFKVEVLDENDFQKSLLKIEKTFTEKKIKDETKLRDNTTVKVYPSYITSQALDSNFFERQSNSPEIVSGNNKNNEISLGIHPFKKRKCSHFKDNQEGSPRRDIFRKSVNLHTNSQGLIMKEVGETFTHSNSQCDIPWVEFKDLPVVKARLKTFTVTSLDSYSENHNDQDLLSLTPLQNTQSLSEDLNIASEGVRTDIVCELAKTKGLFKSPTVLKNLVNFEYYSKSEEGDSCEKINQSEENTMGETVKGNKTKLFSRFLGELKRTSSEISESSDSDTLTYASIGSHFFPSSDNDSDTYVTVRSDNSSLLERRFSEISETYSTPYNTPPDSSSGGFCTPPDNCSPILNIFKCVNEKNALEMEKWNICEKLNPCVCDSRYDLQQNLNRSMIFESPKLEFYESNNSVEDLETFLRAEEGLLDEDVKKSFKLDKEEILERLPEEEGCWESTLKNPGNIGSDVRLQDRRSKKHILSKQESSEECIFLDPQDSSLNLSEEISSPSTTPDTSNKTVIFKNLPLTVSSTIDLEDEDFPLSESDNLTDSKASSKTRIVGCPLSNSFVKSGRVEKARNFCSEPSTPSASLSSFIFPEPWVFTKRSTSFSWDFAFFTHLISDISVPPETVVSTLRSKWKNLTETSLCSSDSLPNLSLVRSFPRLLGVHSSPAIFLDDSFRENKYFVSSDKIASSVSAVHNPRFIGVSSSVEEINFSKSRNSSLAASARRV